MSNQVYYFKDFLYKIPGKEVCDLNKKNKKKINKILEDEVNERKKMVRNKDKIKME